MNADNLRRVADAIEAGEIAWLGFNMGSYVNDRAENEYADRSDRGCGTAACVAGWTACVCREITREASLLDLDRNKNVNIHVVAAAHLGLSDVEAHKLFFGNPSDVLLTDVTPAMAVATLRHAAEHGVVDWDQVCGAAGLLYT